MFSNVIFVCPKLKRSYPTQIVSIKKDFLMKFWIVLNVSCWNRCGETEYKQHWMLCYDSVRLWVVEIFRFFSFVVVTNFEHYFALAFPWKCQVVEINKSMLNIFHNFLIQYIYFYLQKKSQIVKRLKNHPTIPATNHPQQRTVEQVHRH